MFRLIIPESVKTREDAEPFSIQVRAPNADSFSHKSLPKIPLKSPPRPLPFLIPHS